MAGTIRVSSLDVNYYCGIVLGMRVLVACEFSGNVRDAFRDEGHDAWSCDVLPTESDPSFHIQCDVTTILNDGWDLMIAHPPCTYLAQSGVRWLHTQDGRMEKMYDAAKFFRMLWDAPIPRIAVENSIMHRAGKNAIGVDYDQLVQPWMHGHTESKAMCLWLRNLPYLEDTDNVYQLMKLLPANQRNRVHHVGQKVDRWKDRSRTPWGVAEAMAKQWGSLHG